MIFSRCRKLGLNTVLPILVNFT